MGRLRARSADSLHKGAAFHCLACRRGADSRGHGPSCRHRVPANPPCDGRRKASRLRLRRDVRGVRRHRVLAARGCEVALVLDVGRRMCRGRAPQVHSRLPLRAFGRLVARRLRHRAFPEELPPHRDAAFPRCLGCRRRRAGACVGQASPAHRPRRVPA